MLKFYFNGSPNPTKVALFLEEAGLPYEPVPVDTRRGQQFDPAFLALNPNGKVPVIVDKDGATVFDSKRYSSTSRKRQVNSCPRIRWPRVGKCCPG